jgi:hypothetical protein
MSSEFIFVVGCIGNSVKFAGANVRKSFILVLAVLIDFLSLLIMLHFFTKLEKFNGEYLKIYNDNNLTMRDFAIQCEKVVMDDSTQDTRLVKMKIWMHFTKILNKTKYSDGTIPHKVIDVTLSISTQEKLQTIFKMQATKARIAELKAEDLKDDDAISKIGEMRTAELDNLKNVYLAQKKRYTKILNDEMAGIVDKNKIPTPINVINFIFVTFQHPASVKAAQDIFVKESIFDRKMRMLKKKPMTVDQIEQEFLQKELTVK